MGEIRVGGKTVAVFESGTVYDRGSTYSGEVMGYYGGGKIEDRYHTTVAKYSAGTAYNLETILGTTGWETGSALYHCSGTTIYEGGSSWNNTVGGFTGDSDGACAAAVLYFSLHSKIVERESMQERAAVERVSVPHVDLTGFWGGLVVAALCLLVIYVFWFTNSGRKLLFGEPEGIFVFGACILSALIGSYKILKQDSIKKLGDIIGAAALWYLLALFLFWIMGIISGIVENAITFGNCLMLFFGGPFVVVGAAAPVFIAQVLILKCIKK